MNNLLGVTFITDYISHALIYGRIFKCASDQARHAGTADAVNQSQSVRWAHFHFLRLRAQRLELRSEPEPPN